MWDRSSLALHAQVECESQVTCVAWQPNGRHLYASTSDDGVVLYEKNGLEHGKFGIRSSGLCRLRYFHNGCFLMV